MTTLLQSLIMRQEGTGPMKNGRFLPYDDETGKALQAGDRLIGKLTIGNGRNLTDTGISADESMMFLNSDLANAIDAVRHNFSCYDQLSEIRRAVLVSMAYNLGRERLSQFVRFIGAVHLGHWDEAADQLLDSKAAREDAPDRYKELADMMRSDTAAWV